VIKSTGSSIFGSMLADISSSSLRFLMYT
jgi:hypothetical protein